ncbi:MAG: polysaccharide biosynthesis protein [Clostridiales bacterium]|nr:polysaccharide biosynthesis protein [Clostridiales bacterium]
MDKEGDKKKQKSLSKVKSVLLIVCLDVVFAFSSYWFARAIMLHRYAPNNYAHYELMVMFVMVIVTIAMLTLFDCYNSVWKYAGRVEFFKFLFSYFASSVLIFLFKIVCKAAFNCEISAPLIIMYLLFSAICSGTVRFIHGIINYVRHVHNLVEKDNDGLKRTIVIGAGYTGTLAINRFINNPSDGYVPVAVIDDDPDKQDRKIYGVKVEGGMDRIDEIVERHRAQAIVIAIMTLTKSQLRAIYGKCTKFNLPIKIMPAITNADEMSHVTLELRDIKVEELLGRDEFKVKDDLMNAAVKDKVVMVTGGAGSIGSELCRQALYYGCKHLIIFDMHENGMFFLNEELKKKFDRGQYTLVIGTVRERQKLSETLSKYRPEIVFHAAAYKHVPMMEIAATEAIKNNVFGTLNTIEECEKAGVKRFVLVSTDKAVNPANVMGASKRLAEMLIQTRGKVFNMQMAAVRFGNVLGSNGSVIPIFLKQIKEGGPITLTDRNIKRYFMTIPEAVRLVMQTAALASSGEVFVLDMGEPVYIYDLACDLIRINGLVPEDDIPIVVTGLRPGEKLFEELRYDRETVDKTQHEGIFVTRLEKIDGEAFNEQLQRLHEAAFCEDARLTEEVIFETVPSGARDEEAAKAIAATINGDCSYLNENVNKQQPDPTAATDGAQG